MFRLVFLAFAAALLVGIAPAAAQRGRAGEGDVKTLDRILPQIRNRYPGTFYDAEGPFPDQNGAPHYRLKWLTPEGRVIWLDTDARSGRVVGVKHGWARRENNYAGPPADERAPPQYRAGPEYNGRAHFGGGGFPPGEPYGDRGPGREWGGHGAGQRGHGLWNGGNGRHGGGHHGGDRGHHGR